MLLRKLFKNRGLAINMMACVAFLALAVYGWGMTIKELLHYFFVILICLVVVVGLAMLAGFILQKLTSKRDDEK